MNNNKHYHVLITRPEQQGRKLAKTLLNEGFDSYCQPLFGYQTSASLQHYQQALHNPPDIIIFISVAAVQHANHVLPLTQWPTSTWIAVGQATADIIKHHGIDTVITPKEHTSEGVLSLGELREPRHKKVLIVRGNGGRELMADTLTEQGASVAYIEAYQRQWLDFPDDVCQQWRAKGINCVAITSNDLLQSVVQLLNDQKQLLQDSFWQRTCLWIVVSERVANNAKALGLQHVVCAYGASDEAILKALNTMEQEYDR